MFIIFKRTHPTKPTHIGVCARRSVEVFLAETMPPPFEMAVLHSTEEWPEARDRTYAERRTALAAGEQLVDARVGEEV